MASQSDINVLLIDTKEKVTYSIPVEEGNKIKEAFRNKYFMQEYYIQQTLPVGKSNVVYNSSLVGEIVISDRNRYIITKDTPAARVLYGQPINKYTSYQAV